MKNSSSQNSIVVFSDFDGTIAQPNTLNHLTEIFAGVAFRREIGSKLVSGELSLREGIRLEVGTIRGSLEDVLKIVKRDIVVDEAFIAFARWCRKEGIPLTVLSNGIQEIIESILSPYDLESVQILANPIKITNDRWVLHFRDESKWGHDKGGVIRKAKAAGWSTVFIGDGLSDQGGAREADVVFAKAGLARFCTSTGIPFEEFGDFSHVLESLKRRFNTVYST